MELQEEVLIPLPRDVVFNALNDPEVLQQSIPGCEEITKHSDTQMEATVVVKFGPVKASFNSDVTLDPSEGPEKFQLSGKGDAGIAGFATGGAVVTLTEQGSDTLLAYVQRSVWPRSFSKTLRKLCWAIRSMHEACHVIPRLVSSHQAK